MTFEYTNSNTSSQRIAFIFFYGIIILMCCFQTSVESQTITGSISGAVQDERASFISGASILAENIQTGSTRFLLSDSNGYYRLSGLNAGLYTLKLEQEGFQTLIRDGIELAHGQDLILDLVLFVGQPSSEITVFGQTPLIGSNNSQLGGWIENSQIDKLPLNGRNVFDLSLLQVGVNPFPQRPAGGSAPLLNHGTWFSINGASVRSNSFLLDGIPVNDPTVASTGSIVGASLGMEAIREFQVLTNTYSAEHGRVAGGIVNAVTRGGENNFHGSLFEYHRNKSLDARNFFDPAQKPNFVRNQFGGSLGVPIKRDRTFFFTTTEVLRERLGVTTISPVPSAAIRAGTVNAKVKPYLDLFPEANVAGSVSQHSFTANQPTNSIFHRSRFDHLLEEGKSVFATYSIEVADRIKPSSYPSFSQKSQSRNQYLTLEGSFMLSPDLLLMSRMAYGMSELEENNQASFAVDSYKVNSAVATFPQILIGGYPDFGPTAVALFELDQRQFSFSQDLTYQKGIHAFKAGFTVDQTNLKRSGLAFESGRFKFGNINSFVNGIPFLYIGTTLNSAKSFEFKNTYWGGYLEDGIRLHRNFHLRAGIRWEFATVPKEKIGASAGLKNPLTDSAVTVGKPFKGLGSNWGPRVGFTWGFSPKTVLRGGMGRHYDLALIPFATHISATGMPPAISRTTLFMPAFPNPPLSNPVGSVSPQPMGFHLQTPRMDHYDLGVQHEIFSDTLVSVGYVGSHGANLIRRGDVNLALPQTVDGKLFFPTGSTRQNTNFGTITSIRSDGTSSYHALQMSFKRRFSQGLSFNASYAWSRAIDDGSTQILALDAGGGAGNVFNPFNNNSERGLSDFHMKHRFLLDYAIDLPSPEMGAVWMSRLLEGWSLMGIVNITSGRPFDVFVTKNRSGSLNGAIASSGQGLDRPNLASGRTHSSAILGGPNKYFDPSAFELQSAGYYGNLGRNSLIGPGFAKMDLSMVNQRTLSVWNREIGMQFRLEAFNLLNNSNFGFPNRVVFTGAADNEAPLSTAGMISSTVSTSRQLQIVLRATF